LKWDEAVDQQETVAKSHVARLLSLSSPETIVFGQNTHEFVLRLLSCFPDDRSIKILTTHSEFHSFSRQMARLEEAGLAEVTRVSCTPYEDFSLRFSEAAAGDFDLIYFSHVFFDSGFSVQDLSSIVQNVSSDETFMVIDGYHSFMARPVDLSAIEGRCFFIAGGYKYAMAGEGVCFMHCPPGYGERPVNTGWYAAFGQLSAAPQDSVPFAENAMRFKGSTYDPTGLYRFNAVQAWLNSVGESVEEMCTYSQTLQQTFLSQLDQSPTKLLSVDNLLPLPKTAYSARFLTFELANARDLQATLESQNVITDCRGTRLRLGFSIYQAEDDVGRLITFL
jgi:selenocysteine lyase/cysteine desulfurase